jgi:hypothetical protein
MQPVPGGQSTATMQKDMMSRMAAEDARLETLVADMNMFTGEMKIDAMARVLTLLAERNLMMRRHMMEMHGRMMSSMSEAMGAPPTAGAPNGVHGRQRVAGDVPAAGELSNDERAPHAERAGIPGAAHRRLHRPIQVSAARVDG